MIALPILLVGSYKAAIKRDISLLVFVKDECVHEFLRIFRGRKLMSSVVALWTSISTLHWIVYSPEFAASLLSSIVLSFAIFGISYACFAYPIRNQIKEGARTYYCVVSSTFVASAFGAGLFCFFVFVRFTPPLFTSFFSALASQPTYAGETQVVSAAFGYMAYANAAFDYGVGVFLSAYDGDAIRVVILCLISFPTFYGITSGLSAFFVPCDHFANDVLDRESGASKGNFFDRFRCVLAALFPFVAWFVVCLGFLWLSLQFVAPFIERIYDTNRSLQRAEQENFVVAEVHERMRLEKVRLKEEQDEWIMRAQEQLEREKVGLKEEQDEWIRRRLDAVDLIVGTQRSDALCSAFATLKVTGTMFAFWYEMQSDEVKTDFVLEESASVQEQLRAMLFSPDPFLLFEKIVRMESELGETTGGNNGMTSVKITQDRDALAGHRESLLASIILRMKEAHYRTNYRSVEQDDSRGRNIREWFRRTINQNAIRRLCSRLGASVDQCVEQLREYISIMGTSARLPDLYSGATHELVIEEIDRFKTNVLLYAGVPEECEDL